MFFILNPEMKDIVTLINRVKKGDKAAFDELYRLHYPALRTYAGMLLRDEEAEDAVQDVFLNIWLHKERLDDSLSFRGYLLRAVYNTALNIIKHRSYTDSYSSVCEKEIEEMGYNHYDPDACDVIRRLYLQDIHADISSAINSLPPKCRDVFSLSYLQNVPSKEISLRLGISLRTVENHIYAALKLLRDKLGKYKITRISLLLLLYLIK